MNIQKWTAWMEIVASVAVVITLGFLVYEVRQNTAAIERQAYLDRQARLIDPYLNSEEFRTVYSIIKNKDGREPRVFAFIDRYGLTDEQAVFWVRHLDENWAGIAADFAQYGPSDELDALALGFLTFPDALLYWESALDAASFSDEFRGYVESLRMTEQSGEKDD